jgi:hypothetical protein
MRSITSGGNLALNLPANARNLARSDLRRMMRRRRTVVAVAAELATVMMEVVEVVEAVVVVAALLPDADPPSPELDCGSADDDEDPRLIPPGIIIALVRIRKAALYIITHVEHWLLG